jgi:site-specific recombinase XerD
MVSKRIVREIYLVSGPCNDARAPHTLRHSFATLW